MTSIRTFRRGLVAALLLGACMAVPAAPHGGGGHASHGTRSSTGARPGTGVRPVPGNYPAPVRAGGAAWWGLGLGLGLGWDAEWPGYAYPYGYPYGYPVYPGYPPVAPWPPVTEQMQGPQGPPPGTVMGAPVTGAYSYFCESARRYYPDVPQCAEPWRVVPATP